MTKSLPLALLISAGLLSSTATASAVYLFTGDDYSYVDFSDADLSYANMRYITFIGATFRYTNLTGADLTNALLYDADLTGANLTNASLSFATLTGADLTGATVSYSNWTDFSTNSGASGLGSYSYNTSLINYAGNGAIPEPSTYGLIGIAALGVALAARRRKLKTA